MKLGIVILAAGQGTRMKSDLPKVLHCLAGRPLLEHVIASARQLSPERIVVVYGHGGNRVRDAFDGEDLAWVEQAEQLGTGHALQIAAPQLAGLDQVLVLYGDVPLTRVETLQQFVAGHRSALSVLTVELSDPTGYGRIVRDIDGAIQRIVEQKDATDAELAITEINTGILMIDAVRLESWLARLSNDNAQREYYLTDLVGFAVGESVEVGSAQPQDSWEVEGVNSRAQLATLERIHQRNQAERLMADGVTLSDPARFDLRGTLRHGRDLCIDVNVIVEGEVVIGDGVTIGAGTVLRDCVIGDGVEILEHCVIEQASVGPDSRIGPFSRLRPETELVGGAHVGNFVEIKKSRVGLGSKINHLTYIGDTEIGAGVNIGAGTITCNYDGANKHRTEIGDNVFIGSNASLVAPVRVKDGATVGAGSVITKDAPADQLTVTRARQVTVPGWQRPVKKDKPAS